MKRLLILAFAVATAAVPAFAQPVRDLYEALAAQRQHARDLEPAMALAKETQTALKTMNGIQSMLLGAKGTMSLDKAVSIIDDYTNDLTARRSFLPRDVMAIVLKARKMFDDARVGPPLDDLQPLRDRFHHGVVAALERRVLQDADQLANLAQSYDRIQTQLRFLQMTAMSLSADAAREPGKPEP